MKIKILILLCMLGVSAAIAQETLTPVIAPQTVFKTKLTPAEVSAALTGMRGLIKLPDGVDPIQLQSVNVNFMADGSAQVTVHIRPQTIITNSP